MKLVFFVTFALLNACIPSKRRHQNSTLYGAQTELTSDLDPGAYQSASRADIAKYVTKILAAKKEGLGLGEKFEGPTVLSTAWNGGATETPPTYSRQQLDEAFRLIRETRFMQDVDGNIRRLSWLFPDDGCFTRAEIAADLIAQRLGIESPKKIFSFGSPTVTELQQNTFMSSLIAMTTHHPSGKVTWWYHVAPVVITDGVRYVLDPSIEPTRPLTSDEWLVAQEANGGQVGASVICDSHAYVPGSLCSGAPSSVERAKSSQFGRYLPREWNRLLNVNRSPREVLLGDQFLP